MYFDPLHSHLTPEIALQLQDDEAKALQHAAERDAAKNKVKQKKNGAAKYGSREHLNSLLNWGRLLLGSNYVIDPSDNTKYRHANSQSGNYSLRVFLDSDRAYALSPNDPLYSPEKKGHDKFSAYTILIHSGDAKAARRALLEMHPDPTIGNSFVGIPLPSTEQTNSHKGLRTLLTPAEFLAGSSTHWLIKHLIPTASIGCIYGESGSGKSFLALDLAKSFAEGIDFYGHKIVKCTKVVYVALEGRSGLRYRVQAQKLSEAAQSNVRFFDHDIDLRRSDQVEELAQSIVAACGVGAVVIVDTFNQATVGAEENSSKDMGEALAGIKHLQAAIGGTVIIVHHAGKDAARGMRGHSLLFAAMDFVIAVERRGKDRSWRLSKSKDGEELGPHPFALVPYTVGIDEEGQPITTCVVKPVQLLPTSAQPPSPVRPMGDALVALNALQQLIRETPAPIQSGVRKEDWRTAFNRQLPNKSSEAQRKAFQRACETLLANGWVTEPHPSHFRDAKGGDL